jgi:hypothetical protein
MSQGIHSSYAGAIDLHCMKCNSASPMCKVYSHTLF